VSPDGPQGSWSWRERSRDEQALEFLNVCAGAAEQGQLEAAQQKVASTMVHFFAQFATLGIVCPTLYFCGLLPLQFDGLPAWCWGSYYWMCMLVAASVFAQSNISVCWGVAPHWSASLCVLTAMIVVAACFAMAGSSSTAGRVGAMAAHMFCVLTCIYWPSFHRVWCCAWRGDTRLMESLLHLAGMTFGAVPCALATGAYLLVLHHGWSDDARLVVVLLVIWSALPFIMKLTGKYFFVAGSPANPAWAPVLWQYYIEVTFACLGLGVFNQAAGSAIAYAVSFAALLVLQVARGSQVGFRCLPCMGSISLHRLIIFFEMFAALIGRVASYTLFLCFGILRLVSGEVQSQAIVSFADTLQPWTINIYGGQSITVASMLIGLLGFTIVVSIFVAFIYLLPMLWAIEAHDQHEDSKATGESCAGSSPGIPHEAWPEHGAEGASASPAIGTQAPFPGKGSSWIQETGLVPARSMQYRLLLSFMAEYRLLLVSTLVFIFGMCIILVDLASGIAAFS